MEGYYNKVIFSLLHKIKESGSLFFSSFFRYLNSFFFLVSQDTVTTTIMNDDFNILYAHSCPCYTLLIMKVLISQYILIRYINPVFIQSRLPWSLFFDTASISNFVPVIGQCFGRFLLGQNLDSMVPVDYSKCRIFYRGILSEFFVLVSV